MRDVALAALMMHGYRPDNHRPGHHVTVEQSLPVTIGAEKKRVAVLDALRRQRNVSDYTGEDIDESTVEQCRNEAKRLIDDVLAWRRSNRPALLPK